MSRRPVINPLVLTIALLIGAGPYVGPYVVRAAGLRGVHTSPESSPIANVDIQKIYEESEARVQADTRIRTFSLKAYQNFEDTAKLQYITPEETEDLSRALNAEKPSAADAKKIATIRASDTSRSEEYQKLSTKKQTDLTAQDRERMRELSGMVQQRPMILDRLQKFYQEAVDEEASKQRRQGVDEVRAAVQKMAKDQGFTQVFDVSALVYAPNDLTDQAMRKLKAKVRDSK